MDITFLLFLQDFRENAGAYLAPFMNLVTEFSAGFWPIALMCMIYWAFDRKAGRKIIAGLGGGLFINGFLKVTFCIYRPWIRDTRESFPSEILKPQPLAIPFPAAIPVACNCSLWRQRSLVLEKETPDHCRNFVSSYFSDYVFTQLSGSSHASGCSSRLSFHCLHDVSGRVPGRMEFWEV